MILLDTNVLSETRRRNPDTRVTSWLEGLEPETVCISVLTLGELVRGLTLLTRRDPRASRNLQSWIEQIRADYAESLVQVDAAIAEEWGRLSAIRPMQTVDGLIAATASVHGMTLATRNVRDFADTGIALVNPWEP